MTSNHIDQLAQWWDEAEQGTPREGDTYIARFPGRAGYDTGVVDSGGLPEGMLRDTRILARAPKPKPAWHDADFVVARYENDDHWQGCLRHGDLWIDSEGRKYTTGVLRDVTPLIEAKVTDEMVERARHRADALASAFIYSASEWHMREVLAAALGLETE